MRKLALAAVVSLLGTAATVGAQVIGTYGTPDARLGYYSPYPGALYSPYRQSPAYHSYGRTYYNPGLYDGYSTYRHNPGPASFPQGMAVPTANPGYRSFPNPGSNRRRW
jgi:hypothetical protein